MLGISSSSGLQSCVRVSGLTELGRSAFDLERLLQWITDVTSCLCSISLKKSRARAFTNKLSTSHVLLNMAPFFGPSYLLRWLNGPQRFNTQARNLAFMS